MGLTIRNAVPRFGALCRVGAAAVIAGIYRSRTVAEVNDRIAARPVSEQVAIVGGVLAALFTLSLFAAQFGLIGILVFWLCVIVLVN